ncbi:hypothetical protein [Salinibacterium sp. ZJ70]|uniref:hypothetical protein n=1 Tax=Salinibacterium sp. ZJ70 TaxID=2708084 RepID=UPI0014205ABC|nr:hypothetical protein [Salinibacterium sp. ZJ70]
MPFPLIPLAVGAVALVSGAVVAGAKTRDALVAKKLAATRVAILGRQHVGKTALLTTLQKPSVTNALPASASPLGGQFELEVDGHLVPFTVPRDLPGGAGLGYGHWKTAFDGSGSVWYLFRADRVAAGDHDELAAIKSDVDVLASWLTGGHHPSVMLIGTWADADPDWMRHPRAFARRVASVDAIKVALVKLRGAKLVIGSLSTIDDAERLRREIRRNH